MRLDGFSHAPGAHCGSTSLRNLSDYYGWGYTEPECFGLASGLGFSYLELPESPHRLFFGRPIWLERAFFENLYVPHTEREGEDWDDAWRAIERHLDAGDPVMVFTDIYHLDYYDTDTHFAPHSLLAVGYDESPDATATAGKAETPPPVEEGVVYTADSEFDDLQALPLSSLRAAMTSDAVVPLQHRYLVVEGDPRRDVEAAAGRAIGTTARYVLDGVAPFDSPGWGTAGVAGIRALAADLPTWHELPDPAWTTRFAYQNVERRGTGGGAFRGLYAPFLDSLAGAAGLDESFAERMHALAGEWTTLGELLKEASERPDETAMAAALADAGARAGALADREEAFFEDVLDALDGR